MTQVHTYLVTDSHFWLGTDGGVYWSDGSHFTQWTSRNGMGGVDIRGITQTDDGDIYLITQDGVISRYLRPGEFEVVHQAFKDGKREVVANAFQAIGNYIVIGFQDELSLYDYTKQRSIYTIEQGADVAFSSQNIQGIDFSLGDQQDTLRVFSQSTLIQTVLNFQNVDLTQSNLGLKTNFVDPNIWQVIPSDSSISYSPWVTPRQGEDLISGSLWKIDDIEIPSLPVVVSYPYAFEFKGSKWVVGFGNKVYKLKEGSWIARELKSSPVSHFIEVGVSEADEAYVAALSNDTASATSAFMMKLTQDGRWIQQAKDDIFGNGSLSWSFHMKTISFDNSGWTLGSWGGGFNYAHLGLSHSGQEPFTGYRGYDGTINDCMSYEGGGGSYVLGIEFNSVNNEFALLIFDGDKDSRLAFYDQSGRFDCVDLGIGSEFLRSIDLDSEGEYWILTPQELLKVTESGVPYQRSAQVESLTSTAHLGTKVAIQQDSLGRKWILSSQGLSLYCDNEMTSSLCPDLMTDSILNVSSQLDLPNASYSTLEVDGYGNLWIGSNLGLFRIESSRDEFNSSHITKWTTLDGLADDEVFDIAIHPSNGSIWLAHPSSLTKMKSPAQILNSVKENRTHPYLYPSPFAPKKHLKATITAIPRGAKVSILTSSRTQVRSFDQYEIQGGEFQWDGKNSSGKLARPGVYYLLVIEKGGQSHLKKFIIL